jgi:uncharacterized protein (TIGR02588 family)
MTTKPSEAESDRNGKNPLEWTVFAISTLLVLGAIAFLTYSAIAGADRPADLSVTIGEIANRSGSTVVGINLKNDGLRTAAEVNVEVIARYGTEEKISTVLIDFIPKGGHREGFVIFPGTQAPDAITPRVLGYVEP